MSSTPRRAAASGPSAQPAELLDHARDRRRCRRCRPARPRSALRPPRTAAAISCPTPRLCAASAVCTVGGPPSSASPQACAHSMYAVRGAPGRAPTPRSTPSVERPADAQGVLPADPAGQHADEAGAAVGLRGQRERVVGAAAAPAGRDRVGRLHRGEAVAVTVRRDQHLHHGRHIWAVVKPARPQEGQPRRRFASV